MWARSARFDQQMTAGSLAPIAQASLLSGGKVVIPALTVDAGSDGTVNVDNTSAVRQTCDVTLQVPAALVPTARQRTPLDPFGNEVALFRGLKFPDGDTELVPLGVFRIYGSDYSEGQLKLTGKDRAQVVADNHYLQPYTVNAGVNIVTAIKSILNNRLPGGIVYDVSGSPAFTVPTTLTIDEDGDPWDAASTLAAGVGCELFFDALGRCVIRPVPDPATAPVAWRYAEGANALVTATGRAYDVTDTHNGVTVEGSAPDTTTTAGTGTASSGDTVDDTGTPPTPSATVWDTDPRSPTYYLGAFGQKSLKVVDPTCSTNAQCQVAAAARLKSQIGLPEVLTFSALVHPAHDASDVVVLQVKDGDYNDTALLQSFTVPLQGETTAYTCRTRRVISQ